ncbi:hypothetical protein NX722_09375 [Endozoicomonas gorgoniicola]|uniref:Resolvase HTH domain-containing protein n=1 Tax=Endozoicomonas gorgoniicola TaxID=1234144 RepID=A0ABT3MTX6_9GAMM|nr:hypothetical protein [Endozoicomonas gorgoniicola]MCW7552849.1 hypothetical protein [Endozoicomonas gorgoniicola]
MSSTKIKSRATVWINGRQRQKVGYFVTAEEAANWKAKTESQMQRMKLQKELVTKLGSDHPQVQVGVDVLRSEGSQCWRVNDFFAALEAAKNNICHVLGNEYPMLIDGNDLSKFFEQRVEQGVSLGELDIEASLLKIIFQWGPMPQPHRANKVQGAYEQVMRCNVHQLSASEEPYPNVFSAQEVEEVEITEGDSLAARAHQLSLQGMSQREIARVLETSQPSIYRALKKAKLS